MKRIIRVLLLSFVALGAPAAALPHMDAGFR
jgi:hypothetical protein